MNRLISFIQAFYDYLLFFRFGGVYYARRKGVIVGNNCRIYTRNLGSEPFLIRLGNNVTITTGVQFITHDGSGSLLRDHLGRRYYYNKIAIGNNVMVGVNSIILPGVLIEDNVIIAAGSVVNKSVPSNKIVGGVPAKIIGDFTIFKHKNINKWISDEEMVQFKDLPYKKRIEKIVDTNYKPFIQ